jgi:hypothetical protein
MGFIAAACGCSMYQAPMLIGYSKATYSIPDALEVCKAKCILQT